MQTVLLQSDSKSDLEPLLKVAKQLGIKVHVFSKEELEELGLVRAVKEGRTGKFVDTKSYLKKLRSA